ncbi:hypothetical protein [Maridesulfovibrio ferrireducens]|uniref:hypothetical protein n=1 Tax=Maridesulfovibrio ferrireducens TaxID=246191 RepID=UPI001A2C3603|nr:hypothetical protein [Maridesulfovibrio ferrireducens]MBI9113284.1 hypothetical protein [Maridesulfovibrio ferrireducens]
MLTQEQIKTLKPGDKLKDKADRIGEVDSFESIYDSYCFVRIGEFVSPWFFENCELAEGE